MAELTEFAKEIEENFGGLMRSVETVESVTQNFKEFEIPLLDETFSNDSYINLVKKRLNSITNPTEYKKIIKDILHGDETEFLNLEEGEEAEIVNQKKVIEFNEHFKTKYPYRAFRKFVNDVDNLAQDLGFKNESDFREFIESNPSKDNLKLKNIFNKIKTWTLNNKSPIFKGLIALGLGAGFINILKKYNKMNSGCFRYSVNNDGSLLLERGVYINRFCEQKMTENDYYSSTNPITILAEDTHPLFNISIWNCQSLPLSHLKKLCKGHHDTNDILNQGCNGICNPYNYSILLPYIKEKEKEESTINLDFINKDKKYIYRCEKGTILRNLAQMTGDGIYQVFDGISHSALGHFMFRMFSKVWWIFLIGLIVLIISVIIIRII